MKFITTMMSYKIDNLFQNDLPKCLNLNRNIRINSTSTKDKDFDLKDKSGSGIVLPKGTGDASFHNSLEKEFYILDFENLRNKLNPCAILDNEKITKKCDYFIAEREGKSICIFNEITSSQEKYLTKKEDTAKQQLLHSLKCVEKCSSLWDELNLFKRKICLFSFKTGTNGNDITRTFNRPFKEGVVPNEEIEELGFEYRRTGYMPFQIS